MRVGLIDVDGGNRFPNIALMKISAWHKAQGDVVSWYNSFDGWYDLVYMSKVFSFTPDYDYVINATEIRKGGSGYCIEMVNGKEVFHPERDVQLPCEIEHIYPDYSIYPTLTEDTAFGFLTRGCPRGCEFCVVGKKEGKCSRKVADLKEFWNGQKNIVLCDPNILACKDWKDLLQQLIDSKAWVDFNQGKDNGLYSASRTYEPTRINWGEKYEDITMGSDKSSIISGFAQTLWQMKDMEKGVGVFFSNLGYGYSGSGSSIPAYAPLIFEIELVAEPED